MTEIRLIRDHDNIASKDGYMQKTFIIKEGVQAYLKLTQTDNEIIEENRIIPQGKEAKIVIMVQIKDLGNWDARPDTE